MSSKQLFSLMIGSTFALWGCSPSTSVISAVPGESYQPGNTLTIGGSSETYETLELLAEAYQIQVDGTNSVDVKFLPPSQTSSGISGVNNNVIDVGGMSRPLTDEDAKEKLVYIPLQKVPLVIAIHSSVTGIKNITADQIRAVYAGEITNWKTLGGPNENITLLDFTEDENEKQVLRKAYLGAELKVTPDAIVFAEDDQLIEMASITDFSMAAVPLEEELEDLPLNILSIDGVEPSAESIQSGDYAMSLTLGMIISEDASATGKDFAEFVESAEGKQLLETLVE